jgi:excisionase family DNA binding protein
MKSNVNPADEWLSLPEAARWLGVHNSTLRRWADNGAIPMMRTPGGHRRFALADIERFANENWQANAETLLPSITELTWAQQAMRHTRQAISDQEDEPWLATITEPNRWQHRILGQKLMGLTLQYVSAMSNHEQLLEEARQIGVAYGHLALENQMSMVNTLQATLFFRDMLVETALNLSPAAGVLPEDNLRLVQRINQMINTVHLAIVSAYEK